MLQDRLLNDRYRVGEMIGGGGMANVYLAHDTILNREVAVKVLRLEHGNDEEFIARFHREAQSATSLSHPNIVNIYDVGEEDDIYYMVMEYVDGMTLKQYIQQHSPIDASDAVDIMRQVASAIAHAHDNEIVHRDIKPQNILIDHYGHVKVTDFGIAMALSATSLTQTNSVLGSVHYLSPEQARGGVATKKSDIYSLGIVFFELLTGRLPFSGESPVSIALKHLQHETPSLKRWNSDLPQSVENIVLKATAKDPFHRYESVLDMEQDIETSLELDRRDEAAFEIPQDDEEEMTKAIPVITNDVYGEQTEEDTIIHSQPNGVQTSAEEETQEYNQPPAPAKKGKKKKNKKVNKPKKPKKKRKVWPWIVTILILLLLGGGTAAALYVPGFIRPAEVEMIDVAGMEYEEAYSELSDLNLKVNRETMFSEDVEEGMVIRTDPEAGRTVQEESEVTVYSSLGRERVEFEDYTGEDFDSVEEELRDKGYSEIERIPETSDQPPGEITAQLSPEPGTKVLPDETKVIFRVSSGPPTIDLGRLDDMTKEQAESYLDNRNLKMQVVEEYSDEVEKGRVITQDPDPYTEVKEGSTVTITVSLGPEEKPPREETVSVEVPFDEASEETEQKVLIYVDDLERDMEEPVIEETITETTSFDITLTIAEDTEAAYKVQRGDEVIAEESVSY
ncbi:Stk1 family PASTA domain-containing Ser/Thr kinase [Halobacillus sp. ACCC02827]|uniref:Stk1 family PASTA domain-containing Ser/Thr kinase n=1 Tax=Halobacillus sp. ACCC02827 TaxID=3052090 RepID=UPI0025711C4B|nr:Stk1 family PASTA domain-containing Ser/Thr kinase [Halobacillus sp. ACCC02827]WJE17414.1 Stk1 family PASTA domain-containing Ser/Thr kinase [Halobacillus sp. ACCC02827]